ncbi:LysM peptidoglycan-binding domain-containing protein [Candidatus Actinomarina]|nr:LysM peptidoglycan-binding domain-containing protein [Candidatus Actinomarina sp.]
MNNFKNVLYLLTFVAIFSYISTPYLINNNQQVAVSNETSYKVVKGDNLWIIGYKLNVDNISKFIFEVKKVNNLAESTLSVDQIIKIP